MTLVSTPKQGQTTLLSTGNFHSDLNFNNISLKIICTVRFAGWKQLNVLEEAVDRWRDVALEGCRRELGFSPQVRERRLERTRGDQLAGTCGSQPTVAEISELSAQRSGRDLRLPRVAMRRRGSRALPVAPHPDQDGGRSAEEDPWKPGDHHSMARPNGHRRT